MNRLILTALLLMPLWAVAAENGAPAATSTGYSECTSVTLYQVGGREVNARGIPDADVVKIPAGWDLVSTVANTKYALMILCR